MRLALAACCGLLLSACAPTQPSRPEVPALKLADCTALYPHPNSVPDLSPAEASSPPAQLASLGEAHLALSRFRGCQQDDAVLQDQHLAASAKQLQYDQQRVQQDLAAWQKRDAAAEAARDRYQADCAQSGLPDAQYQSCLQRSQDLNLEVAALNSANAELSQRSDALNARIQDYDQQIASAPAAVQDAYTAYLAAVKSEGVWLDRARDRISSTEYRAAAAGAGCPDVMAPPQSVDAMHALATSLIACLKLMP